MRNLEESDGADRAEQKTPSLGAPGRVDTKFWLRCLLMPARRKLVRPVALIFFAIALLFFASSALWLRRRLRHDLESLQWPAVTGQMLQSEYLLLSWHHGTGVPSHYYYAGVTYWYRIEGTNHLSHQICLWNPDLRHEDPSKFVKDHPVGSSVDVFYEPKHPENSVLIRGAATTRDEIAIAAASVGALAAGWGFIRCRRILTERI
jgi:hypothetical protein